MACVNGHFVLELELVRQQVQYPGDLVEYYLSA